MTLVNSRHALVPAILASQHIAGTWQTDTVQGRDRAAIKPAESIYSLICMNARLAYLGLEVMAGARTQTHMCGVK